MSVLVTELAALRAQVATWRGRQLRVGLVPTMGALHAGHISLVEAARKVADRVVVTIFVNPTQFAPNEDFSSYPRDLEVDRAKVAAAGADLIYAPELPAMYPAGFATTVTVAGPATAGLEDAFRPTHFAGVATIVVKLLMQTQPDVALFGEKDFQQLKMIEAMVRDLDIPIEIRGAPIVREADGLALSSRNVYLSAHERARAPALHAALARCAEAIAAGAMSETATAAARVELEAAGFAVDYVEAREASSLGAIAVGQPARVLAAARLGRTRLIDNLGFLAPPTLRPPANDRG